jgi:hypothetical protein
MSLLDLNSEIELTPSVIETVFGIPAYTERHHTKFNAGWFYEHYIEVWYPGSTYLGSVWEWANTKIDDVVVIIIGVAMTHNHPLKETISLANINFDEFTLILNSLKDNNKNFLNRIYIDKPYKLKL